MQHLLTKANHLNPNPNPNAFCLVAFRDQMRQALFACRIRLSHFDFMEKFLKCDKCHKNGKWEEENTTETRP